MAKKLIYVRPARPHTLVAFFPHRPGAYIGVRHATKAEREDPNTKIVAEAFGGHAYVVAEPPFSRVEAHPHYDRLVLDGDLVIVSDAEAQAAIDAISKQHAKAAKKSGDSAKENAT